MTVSTRGLGAALAICCALAAWPVRAGTLTLDGTWQSLAAAGAVAGACGTLSTDDGSGQTQVQTSTATPATGSFGRAVSFFNPYAGNLSATLYAKGPGGARVSFDTGTCASRGAATSPSYVNQAGSTGTDYSLNPLAVPIAGSTLLQTIPATPGRAYVEVQNQGSTAIQIVRDDGAGGNVTSILAAPGSADGQQGGGWSSATFKGRVRIYGASGARAAGYQD